MTKIKMLKQFQQYHGRKMLTHAQLVMLLIHHYTHGQELLQAPAKLPLLPLHFLLGEVGLFAYYTNLLLILSRLLLAFVLVVKYNVTHVTALTKESALLLNSKFLKVMHLVVH